MTSVYLVELRFIEINSMKTARPRTFETRC